MTWSEVQAVFEKNKTFLISSHVNPDGDCIGSQLALYWYLTSLEKNVLIYNYDPVPAKFTFLDNSDKITNEFPQRRFDALIILDASNPSRLGWQGCEAIAPTIINIDHHQDNAGYGTINIIDHTAAATSQILYEFFHMKKIAYPETVAEALYAGILTDTGGFQFTNTNSYVLYICSVLAAQGAACAKIYQNIYTSYSPQGLLLRAQIWSTLTYYANKRICTLEMPMHLLKQSGANMGDIEGMSDLTLTARGVEIGVFMKHDEHFTHFSLRSRGNVDVGKIAQTIPGGGGHTCAAGCTIHQPLEKAKKSMLSILKKEVK